jgi:drug/metabolite transporter (DMT)-like permease
LSDSLNPRLTANLFTGMSTGLLAGIASALIGGAWQVMTRQATTTTMAPADLAVLRYAIPSLVLLPLLLRTGLAPRQVPRRWLAGMILGAGLPFGLVAMSGTMFAPAAHMGVLMAGAAPLFAALFAWALWRERPDRRRALGLGCMALGVALLGGHAVSGTTDGAWRGDLLFVLAAALWAGFTLSFRRAGLTAWQGAALINAWSTLLLVPWLSWRGGFHLFDAPLRDLLWQALWQGVVAGLLGLWLFAAAIERLGAARAASFGALVPAISALGGWCWLGDAMTLVDALAVASAVLGVGLASVPSRRNRKSRTVSLRVERVAVVDEAVDLGGLVEDRIGAEQGAARAHVRRRVVAHDDDAL